MDSNPIMLLIDDVHLEDRTIEERTRFLEDLGSRCKKAESDGKTPILICAGDIGEGASGLKWIEELDRDVVYVCGNHEFYGFDYYEQIDEMKRLSKENPKIRFLQNDVATICGLDFIGTTLWTDLGDFLPWPNKNSVISHYEWMSDFRRITAKKWYSDENALRLKDLFRRNGLSEEKAALLCESKAFSPLTAIDENEKAVMFLIEELQKDRERKAVVVSHHLPIRQSFERAKGLSNESSNGEALSKIDDLENSQNKGVLMMGFYANDLLELIEKTQPEYWLHGHLHRESFELIGKTKIRSSPTGYERQANEIRILEINPNSGSAELEYAEKMVAEYDWTKLMESLRSMSHVLSKIHDSIALGALDEASFEKAYEAFASRHNELRRGLRENAAAWLSAVIMGGDSKPDFKVVEESSGIADFSKKNGMKYEFPHKFPQLDGEPCGEGRRKILLQEIGKSEVQTALFKRAMFDFVRKKLNG